MAKRRERQWIGEKLRALCRHRGLTLRVLRLELAEPIALSR
jgi:hypothetical protein